MAPISCSRWRPRVATGTSAALSKAYHATTDSSRFETWKQHPVAGSQAELEEARGDPVGADVELAVGERALGRDDGGPLGVLLEPERELRASVRLPQSPASRYAASCGGNSVRATAVTVSVTVSVTASPPRRRGR